MNLQGLNDIGVIGAFIIGAAVGIFFTLGYYTARWATFKSAAQFTKASNRGKSRHIEELEAKLKTSRRENVELLAKAKISFESGRASGLIDGRNQGYEAAAESYEAEIAELQAKFDRAQHANVIDISDKIAAQNLRRMTPEQRSKARHPSQAGV